MKSIGLFLLALCGLWLLTGCINIYHESPWEPVPPDVAATITAMAPTHSPTRAATIPPLPSPTPTFSGPAQDYAGTFTYGFEVVAFKPCNSDEVWWLNGEVTAMKDLRTRYEALTRKMEPVHVQLRGLISERGNYGHMGGYQRQLYVLELLDVRDIQPGDCR
ncbi:hypothetical protein GPROT1_02269 [Gammaproteobacteria bacterium]|nr:hypothetical protein GPROT1_02269 [Gammaproteobacteria bacterium]